MNTFAPEGCAFTAPQKMRALTYIYGYGIVTLKAITSTFNIDPI